MKAAIVAMALLVLPACAAAPERYLSAEQDAAMRKQCAADGCVAVPLPLWRQIEQFMRALATTPRGHAL